MALGEASVLVCWGLKDEKESHQTQIFNLYEFPIHKRATIIRNYKPKSLPRGQATEEISQQESELTPKLFIISLNKHAHSPISHTATTLSTQTLTTTLFKLAAALCPR